jgi:hypothetical protein
MAIVTGTWFARSSVSAQPPSTQGVIAAGAGSDFELRGAGSCAAAGCHNGNGPKGAKGSEYTTWVLHDPHARAFEVLYNEQSRRIAKNRHPDVKDPHPERDALCLNCHVQPDIEPIADGGKRLPRTDVFTYEDGVSCEACHGAAGGWLTRHYAAAWRDRSAERKEADGLRNTKDLLVRAEVCVRCHVGEGDRDVNHDLIAAGHPRLNFEYGAYLANMPKHWSEEKDKAGRPDFEARAWALGQAVSARAALELLAHRADEKNKKPWPEFAEYDCFACHHDLRDQEWRRDPNHVAGRLGAPVWGTWYYPMLVEAFGDSGPKGVAGDLSAIRKEMRRPFPDGGQVAAAAKALAERIKPGAARLQGVTYGAEALRQELMRVAADEHNLFRANWDGAAQGFLALAALSRAADVSPRAPGSELMAHVRDLRRELEFPGQPTSGPRYDSPHDFSPDKLRKSVELIRQELRKRD